MITKVAKNQFAVSLFQQSLFAYVFYSCLRTPKLNTLAYATNVYQRIEYLRYVSSSFGHQYVVIASGVVRVWNFGGRVGTEGIGND